MDVIFVTFKKNRCRFMSSTNMYDQFNDFFFDIIVTNDKWSWSIYFEFTLASSLVPKNWVCCGDYVNIDFLFLVSQLQSYRSVCLKPKIKYLVKMPNTHNWHHFVKFLYSIMWNIFVEFLVYITSAWHISKFYFKERNSP